MHKVAIPETVRELLVFGDNDQAGSDAADASYEAHHRHRKVRLIFPPPQYNDFNAAICDEANHDEIAEC
jgi:hypothetical protein